MVRSTFSLAVLTMSVVVGCTPIYAEGQDSCECCCDGRLAGSQYCPDDPWTRGRIWLRQTGHFGLFYNCECEEKKRYSPFICWKKSDSPFPGERIRDCIRCDILGIKQRILDGSATCCGNRKKKIPSRSRHCELTHH